MGVKGLKTYITKQQKDLAEKINIPEEIQKWTMLVLPIKLKKKKISLIVFLLQ